MAWSVLYRERGNEREKERERERDLKGGEREGGGGERRVFL